MMAGGSLVGVGTALYYDGDDFWNRTTNEMCEWLEKEGINDVSEIIGLFHKQ
jgi:dihydroorotate dehydrogenase